VAWTLSHHPAYIRIADLTGNIVPATIHSVNRAALALNTFGHLKGEPNKSLVNLLGID
jgi:hypothetical protein